MRRKDLIRFVSCLLILCCLFCACGSEMPAADPDKEINLYSMVGPTNLDPHLTFSEENTDFITIFMEGLITRDLSGKLIPGIADQYDISEDGLTYTFHIRENARWSDGTPVTAKDFVYGWQRVIDPENASDASYLFLECVNLVGTEDIFYNGASVDNLGITATAEDTLVVKLLTPCPYFLDLITTPAFYPCKQDFYETHQEYYGKNNNSVLSCGPFLVDYFKPMENQIHLSKNPYYYDADSVTLSGVNIQISSDTQQMIMAFEKGEADIIPLSGEFQKISEGDARLKSFPGANITYLLFNTNNEALSNKNIRRALTLSVNRKLIQETLFKNGCSPITRLIPPDIIFEEDGSDFGEDQHLYDEYCRYDPELALQYWNKGLEELGISEITVDYLAMSESVDMDIIKMEWENTLPGFHFKYRTVPLKNYYEARNNREFDIEQEGYIADYADASNLLNLFREGSSTNRGDFQNTAFNEIMDACSVVPLALDPKERNIQLHEAERILMENNAFIPLYSTGKSFMISDQISDISINAFAPFYNFRYAKKEAK